MQAGNTLVYILAFIVLAHLLIGFGYLLYKISSPPRHETRKGDDIG